jgi:hypothetical protein
MAHRPGIHDADLNDEKFGRVEGIAINQILKGWAKQGISDEELLRRGMDIIEGLYHSIGWRGARIGILEGFARTAKANSLCEESLQVCKNVLVGVLNSAERHIRRSKSVVCRPTSLETEIT